MAAIDISRLNTLKAFAQEVEDRYAKKSDLGTLAAKSEVAMSDLAEALAAVINGKADQATTLEGYGITDAMTATEIASAISTAIAGVDHLKRTVVDSLDDVDPSAARADEYIYMVPKASTGANKGVDGDTYDEYMVIDGKLEKVGDWKVDLSDYAKTTEVAQAIATALEDYMTTEEVTQAIQTAAEGHIKLTDLDLEVTGTGNVITGGVL